MNNYKSLDYLSEIKNDNFMSKREISDMLQNIAYILRDNDFESASFFIEDIMEAVDENKIEL